MFAVVVAGGKQYKVEPGQTLKVDYMGGDLNSEVTLGQVLMTSGDAGVTVGKPGVEGVSVRATIVEHSKDKKIVVFKFKSKKRYRKTQGHRTMLTTLRVEEIVGL